MALRGETCNHALFRFPWIKTLIQCFFFFLVVQDTASFPYGRSAPLPNDHYYMNKGVRCLRCPPGEYVFDHCTEKDTRGICEPCLEGSTYSEGLTGQEHCHSCTRCRDDQVEVSPCTLTKNTVCRCKEGTYCRPDHPCEVCESCTPSCPPGEVLHQPCNSTTDSQCGPPTDHPAWKKIVIGICVPTVIIVIILCGLCLRKKYCGPGCSANAKNSVTLFISKLNQEKPLLPAPPRLEFPTGLNDKEKDHTITKTIYALISEVPPDKWEHFMRVLGLSDNLVVTAKRNNPNNLVEQSYEMLHSWHMNNSWDVNSLLETLCSIHLQTAATKIKKNLVDGRLYVLDNRTDCQNNDSEL